MWLPACRLYETINCICLEIHGLRIGRPFIIIFMERDEKQEHDYIFTSFRVSESSFLSVYHYKMAATERELQKWGHNQQDISSMFNFPTHLSREQTEQRPYWVTPLLSGHAGELR